MGREKYNRKVFISKRLLKISDIEKIIEDFARRLKWIKKVL